MHSVYFPNAKTNRMVSKCIESRTYAKISLAVFFVQHNVANHMHTI